MSNEMNAYTYIAKWRRSSNLESHMSNGPNNQPWVQTVRIMDEKKNHSITNKVIAEDISFILDFACIYLYKEKPKLKDSSSAMPLLVKGFYLVFIIGIICT